MTADRFIAADGSVRWHIHGDGLDAIISDAMYQDVQRHADEIREAGRRKYLDHPLFNSEIGVWNGVMLLDTKSHQAFGRIMRVNPQSPRVFYPELPLRPALWLLPDGRAPGETRHTPLGKNYPW